MPDEIKDAEQLKLGTYKDKFGDIRWVGTGEQFKPAEPVEVRVGEQEWESLKAAALDASNYLSPYKWPKGIVSSYSCRSLLTEVAGKESP